MTNQELTQYVQDTLDAYRIRRKTGGLPMHEKYRYLGALEASLIVAGVLTPGVPVKYGMKDEITWNLFFVLRRTRQETYSELIERLAAEWLAVQNESSLNVNEGDKRFMAGI